MAGVFGLTWDGSQWIAAGQGGCTIATSPDGSTWAARSTPFDAAGAGGQAKGVAYDGSGHYVAVGADAVASVTVIKSTDGNSWTAASVSPFAGGSGFGVAYGASVWVAVGSNTSGSVTIASSSNNGSSWTTHSNPFIGTGAHGLSVTWTGSTFIASGSVSSASVFAATSPDGATWTARSTPLDGNTTDTANIVAWNGSSQALLGFSVSSDPTVLYSSSGTTWTAASDPPLTGGRVLSAAWGIITPPAPTVTAVSPTFGPTAGGASVEVSGTSFTSASVVHFGASVSPHFSVISAAEIIAVSPAQSAGTVNVTVTTPYGSSPTTTADHYTYNSPASVAVSSISPASGSTAGGTSVDIFGSGFTSASAVHFGASSASFIVDSDGEIVATSPAGSAGSVNVTVSSPYGTSSTSSADVFTFITPPPPSVTSVSPDSGSTAGGSTINIFGSAFTGATNVGFGATPAMSFSVTSDGEIQATSPAGIGVVNVTVTTMYGTSPTSFADEFTYVAPSETLNYTVRISPTAPFVTPNWQDITQWVQSGNITVGKEHQLDAMQSSSLSLVLNNRLGQFLPWNVDSPFYFSGAGLIPGCPVQITAYDNDANAYPVFYGYVNSWVPSWTDEVNSTCALQATDYLANLSNTLLASNSYATFVAADGAIAFLRLGDPTGSLTAADSIGSYNGVVAGSLAFSGYGGQFGGSYVDDTGTATFGTATQALGAIALLPALSTALDAGAWSFEAWTQILPGGNSGQNNYIIGTMTSASVGGAVYWFSGYGANTPGHGYQLSALTVTCSGSSGFGIEYQSATEAPTSDIADGNWHHVVATGSAATGGTVSLYLDGVLVVSGTAAGGQSSTIYSSTQMALGGFGTYALSAVPLPTGTVVTAAGSSYFGLMGEVAFYNVELNATQVANHYNTWLVGQVVVGTPGIQADNSANRIANILTLLGVPPAFQSIGATTPALGISQVQAVSTDLTSTTALDYLQLVEQTEQGLFFQDNNGILTFYGRHWPILNPSSASVQAIYGDNSANTSYFYLPENFQVSQDDLDLWTSVVTQRLGGVLQFATSASVGAFGSSTREIWRYGVRVYQGAEQLLETTDTEVLSLAQYLLLLSQTPIPRVRSVTLASFVNGGSALPQMFGRKLWDRVMVQRQAQGSQFSQDSLVEQITHEFDYNTWKTTFALNPWFEQGTPWLILDDPIYGQLSTNNQLAF